MKKEQKSYLVPYAEFRLKSQFYPTTTKSHHTATLWGKMVGLHEKTLQIHLATISAVNISNIRGVAHLYLHLQFFYF